MQKNKNIIGLKVRLLAANRLSKVLKGTPFIAFSEKEIADRRDRALANRLITTALRRQGHINYIITQVLKKGMPAKSANFEAILRIGLSELLFMPSQAAHSSIFLSVEAVKSDKKTRHLSKLINAILRNVQREEKKYKSLSNELLFPNWLYKKWQKSYGTKALEIFADGLLFGAPLDLVLKTNDKQLINELKGAKIFADVIRIGERDSPVNKMAGFNEGHWWVQDVAASLPARLMKVKPDSSVLDMCAAPGGKLAQLIKQKYNVTGLEIDPNRLEIIKQNLSRLNYNAKLELIDATKYSAKTLFDAVLLDAPCTATGTFRRHPEILWQRKQSDILNRVKLQRELISNAINCLKPNGILLYATCSLEVEEGEQQANWLLENFPNMAKSPINDDELAQFPTIITKQGFARTLISTKLPNNISGSLDGFFIARFKKT